MKRNQKQLWLSTTLLLLLALLMVACGGQPEPPEPEQEAPVAEEEAPVEEPQQETGQEAEEQPVEEEPAAEEPASGEQTTVTYWHTMSDAEEDALTEVIAMFEAEHPDIHIETTRFAYDDFKSALLTGLAGNEGPDTARLDIIWVPEFAELGALVALDEAMPNFQAIADNTFPGPLATNFWQGNYYGLPQDTNTQVLLWNQDLFADAGIEQPPQTLEEFHSVACELTAGEEQYGYALGGTYFWAPAPVFYAMGGQVVDEEITTADGYINGAESVAAFEMLDAMYDEGCLSPNVIGGGVGTSDGHATGLYAMITDGPWMVGIYENDYPDFSANFAPIPVGPDGSTSSVVGGQDVVLFAGSENQDAALTWVEYLLSDEAQLKMAEAGVIPTVTSVRDNPDLPPYFGVFLDQMETAQARVPHPAWGDMDTAINNAFQRMLHDEQSPQEALDQAAEEINALLQ
jgi:multiple sugar transport system substrate-binding protein